MFKLSFKTDTAAFDSLEKRSECVRILRHIADRLNDECDEGKVLDVNGNTVGSFKLT
jgi:hypothetical protein